MKGYYTIADAARHLRVSRTKLYQLIDDPDQESFQQPSIILEGYKKEKFNEADLLRMKAALSPPPEDNRQLKLF